MVSIVELQKGNYPPDVVIATLKDYADSGAAIIGRIVIQVIDKTPLTKNQIKELQNHILIGIINHGRRAARKDTEITEAGQYAMVYAHLVEKLS